MAKIKLARKQKKHFINSRHMGRVKYNIEVWKIREGKSNKFSERIIGLVSIHKSNQHK